MITIDARSEKVLVDGNEWVTEASDWGMNYWGNQVAVRGKTATKLFTKSGYIRDNEDEVVAGVYINFEYKITLTIYND